MIVVISNCLTTGLTSAIKSLLPDQEVRSFHVAFPDSFTRPDLIAAVREADVCLALPLQESWGEMSIDNLEKEGRVSRFPAFIFTGYHPDSLLIWKVGGGYVPSPMTLHSLLVASGYCAGKSVAETISLFNQDTYASFGYTNAFEQSKTGFIKLWQDLGHDVSDMLDRWISRGVFCHHFNHPKSYVLNELADMMLRKAGFNCRPLEVVENEVPDYLSLGCVWPVYPGILPNSTYPGSMIFRSASHSDRSHFWSTEGFVSQSFRMYDESNSRDDLLNNVKVKKAVDFLTNSPVK